MTTPYPHLFSPGTIAGLELKNRIVQTPMGTGLIDLGCVTDREVAFQEERARSGVGLMITGGAAVHPTSRFPARIIVELWDEDGIEALGRRCDAVHRHGARIFGQLIHLGRETPGGQTDWVPMGPSAVPHLRDPGVPHVMTPAEIPTWESRSNRKASVELPRVKTNSAASNPLNPPSSFFQSPERFSFSRRT